MISINQFAEEFNYRHDFKYDDDKYLENKFPNIKFSNIPEAWVYQINKILSSIYDIDNISSITQVMGFISIQYKNLSHHDINLISKLENQLKLLDIDLYDELKESYNLN